jgi:hypothetical protein
VPDAPPVSTSYPLVLTARTPFKAAAVAARSGTVL